MKGKHASTSYRWKLGLEVSRPGFHQQVVDASSTMWPIIEKHRFTCFALIGPLVIIPPPDLELDHCMLTTSFPNKNRRGKTVIQDFYIFPYISYYFSIYKQENHSFKDQHVKIYTICHYSGFYSSLNDKNWANDGHFESHQKMKNIKHIFSYIYQIPF